MTTTKGRFDHQWAALRGHEAPASWVEMGLPPTPSAAFAAARHDPRVVSGLAARHLCGDELAGRVLIQLALPRLDVMARRDPCHELGDYVGEFWLRLACYPLQRRPSKVMANLTLDTLKSVTREHRRRPLVQDDLVQDDLAGGNTPRLDARRVIQAATDLRLIDERTLRVLREVYLEGWPSREAGERLGMSAESVRWRCSHGVRALARHAKALAAA
jgi:hypothetical protein